MDARLSPMPHPKAASDDMVHPAVTYILATNAPVGERGRGGHITHTKRILQCVCMGGGIFLVHV